MTGCGINCDYETQLAFDMAGSDAQRVHVNDVESSTLRGYQILALPGGFSFGDDLGAGRVLAVKMKKLSRKLREFIETDKLVIGICNGAQVAVKLGIVPNLSGEHRQETTLTYNDSGKFEDRWVYLSAIEGKCVFTRGLGNIYLPVRHGEGKFVCSSEVLAELQRSNQIPLRYSTEDGKPAECHYSENPNSSLYDVAGVCDSTGRVFALMPHPEAHVWPYQHPRWTRLREEGHLPAEGDGLQMFRNAVEYFK